MLHLFLNYIKISQKELLLYKLIAGEDYKIIYN